MYCLRKFNDEFQLTQTMHCAHWSIFHSCSYWRICQGSGRTWWPRVSHIWWHVSRDHGDQSRVHLQHWRQCPVETDSYTTCSAWSELTSGSCVENRRGTGVGDSQDCPEQRQLQCICQDTGCRSCSHDWDILRRDARQGSRKTWQLERNV